MTPLMEIVPGLCTVFYKDIPTSLLTPKLVSSHLSSPPLQEIKDTSHKGRDNHTVYLCVCACSHASMLHTCLNMIIPVVARRALNEETLWSIVCHPRVPLLCVFSMVDMLSICCEAVRHVVPSFDSPSSKGGRSLKEGFWKSKEATATDWVRPLLWGF